MRSAFLTFLTLLFIAPLAQADKLAKYKPPQKFEVEDDFYVIEGAGLVPAGYDGALNVDMWDGSKRAEITKLIKDMPANSPSPAIREMIRAILLSESDTNELDDYDEVIAGEDLLTLRIHKLMEGGFYEEALELYSVAIDIPHHAPIAKAGMLAMLGNGEKSIACLEIKTLGNMDETDPFWSIFIAYCDYTLSETPSENTQKLLEDTPYGVLKNLAFNQDFVFPYSPKDWAAIDVLEQNILIAENRIEAPKLTDELVSTLSAQDIAVLLGLTTFNAQDHLKLQLLGAQWGLTTTEEIAQAYLDTKAQLELVGELPEFYQALVDEEDKDARNGIIIRAINLQKQYGDFALLPFASFLAESDISGFAPPQMIDALRLFYLADTTVSPDIIENYIKNSEKNIGNDDFFITMQAIPLILKMPESHEFMKNIQEIGIFHKNQQSPEEIVIENLDKVDLDVDNADKAYEKGIDVAVQKEHEGVPDELLKQLSKLSKRDILGETVLLSIKLLSDQSIREADQDVYSGSFEALKSVELKEFSRKMAIERLIGDQKEKE